MTLGAVEESAYAPVEVATLCASKLDLSTPLLQRPSRIRELRQYLPDRRRRGTGGGEAASRAVDHHRAVIKERPRLPGLGFLLEPVTEHPLAFIRAASTVLLHAPEDRRKLPVALSLGIWAYCSSRQTCSRQSCVTVIKS